MFYLTKQMLYIVFIMIVLQAIINNEISAKLSFELRSSSVIEI